MSTGGPIIIRTHEFTTQDLWPQVLMPADQTQRPLEAGPWSSACKQGSAWLGTLALS